MPPNKHGSGQACYKARSPVKCRDCYDWMSVKNARYNPGYKASVHGRVRQALADIRYAAAKRGVR